MLIVTYLAEVFGNLGTVAMCCQLWAFPFLIYMNISDITSISRWITYTVVTILVGAPTSNPIQAGWASRNSNAIHSRAVSAALYNMFVQAGGMANSNIYRNGKEDRDHSFRRDQKRFTNMAPV